MVAKTVPHILCFDYKGAARPMLDALENPVDLHFGALAPCKQLHKAGQVNLRRRYHDSANPGNTECKHCSAGVLFTPQLPGYFTSEEWAKPHARWGLEFRSKISKQRIFSVRRCRSGLLYASAWPQGLHLLLDERHGADAKGGESSLLPSGMMHQTRDSRHGN